jgi:hypothetical protein
MRRAYDFSPDWAYPAPSLTRTIGIVLVALAVGATAGSTVVFFFADRPAGQPSVAPRPLAPLIQATQTLSSETTQPNQWVAVQSESAKASGTDGHIESGAVGTSSISSATQRPANAAALAEASLATDIVPARAGAALAPAAEKAPAVAPVAKKATKKRHIATRYAWRGGPLGLLPGEYMNGIWDRY